MTSELTGKSVFFQVVENFMNRFLIHTTKDYHSVSLPLVSVWIQVCLKRLCWECPGTLSSCNTFIVTFYENMSKYNFEKIGFVNCTFFSNYIVFAEWLQKNCYQCCNRTLMWNLSIKFLQPFFGSKYSRSLLLYCMHHFGYVFSLNIFS